MALTYSSMLNLGTEIVPFKLLNVLTNENFSSNNLDHNKSSLIMFICNHCPYVIHYHEQIKILASEYADAINLVAISSNDVVNYPEDSPEKMNQLWSRLGLKFPYLFLYSKRFLNIRLKEYFSASHIKPIFSIFTDKPKFMRS